MHEEQSSDSHLDTPCVGSTDLGEQFTGRIVTRDGLTILIDSKYEVSDDELDYSIKELEQRSTEQEMISPALYIYNGQTSDRSNNQLTYRLFNLRNVNNLDELDTSKLFLLRQHSLGDKTGDKLGNSLNDRLCDRSLSEECTGELDEHMKNSLNEFWSGINLDLCDGSLESEDAITEKAVLMCFICKFTFLNRTQLVQHAEQRHAHLMNAEKYLLFLKQQSAILQSIDGRPILNFLCKQNRSVIEQPNSPAQTNLQVATNNFLNSLLNETQNESQPRDDQKESSAFGDLADLANLESIAKAAAALQRSANDAPDSPTHSTSTQLTNNTFFNNQLLNSLAGSNNLNLVNLLPHLTVQQQQQLQLLASVNSSALLNSNSSNSNTANSLQQNQSNNQSTQSVANSSTTAGSIAATVAGLGQHHMAMLHSRNSCKTLKCPKCNWHYKYQETLEIHMKEKHPETELNCVYCLANQPHPRLARGETYTCGYKPYRCDICNYSTTTKGNLSIHMQSDKHINNMQELQNGNLPPEMLQNLVQQQQQLNQQQQNAAATSNSNEQKSSQPQSTPTTNLLSPNSNATSSALNTSSNASLPVNTSNQTSSSLNNSTNQLTNASGQAPATQQTTNSTVNNSQSTNQPQVISTLNNGSSAAGSKAVWRCDLCKYDTNLARNLRIHMTSEKHMNNMLLMEQNVKQMQQLSALQSAASNSNASNSLDSQTQAMLQQLNPNLLAALANNNTSNTNQSNLNDQSADQALADLTYNQALLLMSGQQAAANNSNNQQRMSSLNMPKQLPDELLALLPSDKQAIVDLEHPDPSLRMDYNDYDEHHCRVFQCMVCSVFTCDSVEQLAAHVHTDRTKIREDEVLGAMGNTFFCKLCPYKTQLKANFQLHCKTDKHLQRLQQVNHIKEGGQSNEWKLEYVNVSNPIQLRCNLCDYYTNSLHKLQLHVTNARHEASTRVFLHLKVDDQLLRANDSDIKQTAFRCEPCTLSYPTIFALLHHLNSARHVQSENFRQIKLQKEISQGKMTMKTLDQEIRELFTVKSEDLENDNQTDLQQSKSTSSSTLSHLLCPLCQSQFTQRANLEQHIIDTHKVSKEGVERLMSIVDSVKENNVQPLNTSSSLNKSTNNQLNNSLNSNHSGNGVVDELDSMMEYDEQETEPLRTNNTDRHLHKFRCTQCPLSYRTADKLALHSHYHKIRAASQCVLCGKTTRSIESMQKHMEISHKEMNEQELDTYRLSLVNNPLLLSLKNGCQGVLDPTTTELLKRESNRDHEQHLPISRLENGDSVNEDEMDELDDEDNDSNNNENSLMETGDEVNEEMDHSLIMNHNNSINQAPNEEYLNSQGNAEDGYNDPARKYKCHRCRVAYTRQSYLSAHNKTLYHRKGEKLTYPMEKYLDPSRPFKCEMCKESFTQKNILMTHYNSVSHLHRQNQAMKELSNQTLNEQQQQQINHHPNEHIDEPFKCNICKLSFSNNGSLDNHIQSAQHQSQTSKLPQLAISGQIDLNRPLVERPNDDEMNQAKNLSFINEQLQLLQQLNAAAVANQQSQQSNLVCQHCSIVCGSTDALNQHQQICFLINNTTAKQQQQQTNSLDKFFINSNTPACKTAKPPVYKHLLETWGYEIVQQFNEHHQRRKNDEPKLDEEGNETVMNNLNDEFEGERCVENLESVGNVETNEMSVEKAESEEIVQPEATTSEGNDAINGETLKLILESQEDDQEEKKENDPNTTNNLVSDGNKSKCDTCMKEFSSIWVLKAHKEEVHKDVVKMQTVQDFAEIYRKEFERKNNIVVKSVVLENDNSNQLANCAQQPQRPQSTQSNSSQNNSTATSISNPIVVDQSNTSELDNSTNECKDPASRSTQSANSSGRLDQSNELNNSTNSNSTNISNNQTNDTNNLLLNNPALTNPLLAASNPLLSQAMASMMNQQQAGQQNDVAQQMAQLQMSQLLMSLSLAGAMGSNQNANQSSPQQQAIMGLLSQGIPPQMLPLLMANAAAADPMMSLLAANPLIAAQNLLSGMSPEMLAATGFLPGLAANNLPNAANLSKSPSLPNNLINQNASSNAPNMSSSSTSNSLASQSLQAAQNAAAAAAAAQSGKRARTRISDDQLKILRQYFDINNSPTEEALQEMAAKSQLPLKVIKHWFRNTLFKERQRNKDSPYNFNNPPSTYLNLEEYEKTGEAKVQMIDENKVDQLNNREENSQSSTVLTPVPSHSGKTTPALGPEVLSNSTTITQIKSENEIKSDSFNSSEDEEKIVKQENPINHSQSSLMMDNLAQQVQQQSNPLQQFLAAMAAQSQQQLLQSQLNGLTVLNEPQHQNNNHNESSIKSTLHHNTISQHSEDSMDSIATNDTSSQPNMQIFSGMQFANSLPGMHLPNSLHLALQNSQMTGNMNSTSTLGMLSASNSAQSTPSATPNSNSANNSANNPGKRANRTRFTDYQIRVLQESFQTNAYPKDDDLDYLSKLLNLSPRVIVVWYQNMRQKSRKLYENQPPSVNDIAPTSSTPNANINLTPCTTPNSATSSNSATPNPHSSSNNNSNSTRAQQLSYDCKRCPQSFRTYYELIKHMKSSCYKDENPVAVNTKGMIKQLDDQNSLSSNDQFSQLNNNTSTTSQQTAIQNGTFQCDKCSMSFNRLDLFKEHQIAHLMNPNLFANLQQANLQSHIESLLAVQQQTSASPALSSAKSPSTTPLPNLFGGNSQLDLNQSASSTSPIPQQQQAFLLLQQLQLQQQANQMNKRKFSNDDEDDESQSGGDGSQCSGGRSAQNARDKRLRTTILPEQLDLLMQKYALESNPSRKMLESISEEVGLKKRVVQVWYQNQRARCRKNQLKPHQQIINKRCPFCRALFKARSALESHLATRHADQYTKGEIDIDALPDSDSGDEQSMPSALSTLNNLGMAGLDNGDNGSSNGNMTNPFNSLFGNNLLNTTGNDLSHLLQGANMNNGGSEMADQLRQLISNIPNLKDFMNNMNNGNEANDDQDEEINDSLNAINNNNNESSSKKKGDFALDLSKPLDLS